MPPPPAPAADAANQPVGYQPNKRLAQSQAQVNEVVDIMKLNVEKVLERDAKLSQLDDRADALQQDAMQFESSAGKLKNKYFWKNMKMMAILGGIVGVILIVMVVWFTV